MNTPRPLAAIPLIALTLCALLAAACQRTHAPGPTASDNSDSEPRVATPTPTPADGWRYHFTLEADLVTLHTRLCFDASPPQHLKPQARLAAAALLSAEHQPAGAAPPRPLTMRRGQLSMAGVRPGDCVRFTQDLDAVLEGADRSNRATRYDDAALMSADYWLWRGVEAPEGLTLRATFETPQGVSALLPWPREGDGYRIPDSAFLWKSHAAWGRFEVREITEAGGTLRVARVGDGWVTPLEAFDGWLRGGMKSVAALFGRFPVDEAIVVITPAWGSRSVFGSTMRGGGCSVVMVLGRGATPGSVADDWVITHELLHLGIPMLRGEDAWMDEGLPTYIEPVLRARVGLITPEAAWEQLHDGFTRGASVGGSRPLLEESTRMHQTRAYWRVYWGGGAIAFLADVAQRQALARGAAPTFDSVDAQLREMWRCCIDEARTWEASEMLSRVASTSGEGFTEVAARHLNQHTFPDVRPAFDALGLQFDEDSRLIGVSDDPDAAALREAIMGGPARIPRDAPPR